MEDAAELRRELIRASNRSEFSLTATEVSDLIDWFENMPGEVFNELRMAGVPFPDGYVQCWRDLNEEDTGTDTR